MILICSLVHVGNHASIQDKTKVTLVKERCNFLFIDSRVVCVFISTPFHLIIKSSSRSFKYYSIFIQGMLILSSFWLGMQETFKFAQVGTS